MSQTASQITDVLEEEIQVASNTLDCRYQFRAILIVILRGGLHHEVADRADSRVEAGAGHPFVLGQGIDRKHAATATLSQQHQRGIDCDSRKPSRKA